MGRDIAVDGLGPVEAAVRARMAASVDAEFAGTAKMGQGDSNTSRSPVRVRWWPSHRSGGSA